MTIGIICTVVLGLISIYQTLVARTYRDAALQFQVALNQHKQALETQRAEMVKVNARLAAIAEVMPKIRAASIRGDARGAYNALATAMNGAGS